LAGGGGGVGGVGGWVGGGRRGGGSARGWCRGGGLRGRFGRGFGGGWGGFVLVVVLSWEGFDSSLGSLGFVFLPPRRLSFRSPLGFASGKLGGSRGL